SEKTGKGKQEQEYRQKNSASEENIYTPLNPTFTANSILAFPNSLPFFSPFLASRQPP
uniref:Uncharacterized protein n=1 Tax=Oryza brachyantha TaxID=4533 RepID=J3MNR4_ORYBR